MRHHARKSYYTSCNAPIRLQTLYTLNACFYWKALLEHNLIKRHNNISLVSFGKRLPCVEVDLCNNFFCLSTQRRVQCWWARQQIARTAAAHETLRTAAVGWLNKIQINRAQKSCSRLLKSGRADQQQRCVFSTQVRGYGIQITSAKSQKASRALVCCCHQYPLHRKIHRCDY